MNKARVKVDINQNRLLFAFFGKIEKKEMEKLYTDVRFCVSDLTAGFDVMSDYSECKLLHLDSIPVLKNIMSYLIEKKMREIVRIIDRKKISCIQIVNLGLRIQGYMPIYVSSVDEADEKLRLIVKRNALRLIISNTLAECEFNNDIKKSKIANISTTGCLVLMDAIPLAKETKINLRFQLMLESESYKTFNINGEVVRSDENSFAVKFIELDNDQKNLLWKCLLYESRR